MPLKFLHLSDIHFKHYGERNYLDLDKDLRNELERDLCELQKSIGSIDAILICGDIAYSASDEEYEIAADWLKTVCKIVNCSEENVLTVPGNHDVNWAKIDPLISDAHKAFKDLKEQIKIDLKLNEYITKGAATSLLKSFENYNNFAQRYGAIPNRNELFWEKGFFLDGKLLRIRGLNSALVSNMDDDEHKSKLILSSIQTQLNREYGVVYLTLCHHPPEWLYDGQKVEEALTERAVIQLFGHKHAFKLTKINNSLKLSAGAVHPSREASNWEPRYNIIELEVSNNTDKKILKVRIWKRIWKGMKYISEFTDKGQIYEEHELEIDNHEYKGQSEEIKFKEISKTNHNTEMREEPELIKTHNPIRKLAYMFFSLPYHTKIRLALELELIEDADKDLPEIQRSQAYFKRVQKKNILDQLWDKVSHLSPEMQLIENPFKK